MRPEIIEFDNGIPLKAHVRGSCQFPYHWHNALVEIKETIITGSDPGGDFGIY